MSRLGGDFTFVKGLRHIANRRGLRTLVFKALRLWQRESWPGILRALKKIAQDYRYTSYRNWFNDYGALRDDDRALIRQHIAIFSHKPRISILMPACNAEAPALRRAIDSVQAQLYPHWELCIVDDESTGPQARAILDRFHRQDERIRFTSCGEKIDSATAFGTALGLTTGEFVALLNPHDTLAEHALYLVAEALERNPNLDMLYSDEDRTDAAGQHDAPYFKPDWNPDLFLAQNIVSHIGIFRTQLARAVGGFRQGFSSAQEWDLALRISEITPADRIQHLPYVLYHTGATARTAAEDSSALAASMAAVREHLVRIGCKAEIFQACAARLRVRYELPGPPPLVSIIIPTRNGIQLLRRCISSIREKTTYGPYEIIVVDNQSTDPETLAYLDGLKSDGIADILSYDAPFNYSAINNHAVRVTRGALLCLLNNDIEVIGADWLGEMVSQAIRPEIGAVGALLYYPDDTIQHAGVIVGLSGCADHLYAGAPRGTKGMMGRACVVQNLSAVTAACLVIRKDIYTAVGGFDESNLPVSFNDVDFCLRVLERGYRNLWTPFAELYHHESATRGREHALGKLDDAANEEAYLRERWPRFMERDPAYNPNLTLGDKWPRQGADPRIRRPWLVD